MWCCDGGPTGERPDGVLEKFKHPDINKCSQPWALQLAKWAAKSKSQHPATRDLEGYVADLSTDIKARSLNLLQMRAKCSPV